MLQDTYPHFSHSFPKWNKHKFYDAHKINYLEIFNFKTHKLVKEKFKEREREIVDEENWMDEMKIILISAISYSLNHHHHHQKHLQKTHLLLRRMNKLTIKFLISKSLSSPLFSSTFHVNIIKWISSKNERKWKFSRK